MKVMLLACEAPEDFAIRDNKAAFEPYMNGWRKFGDSLREAGIYVAGSPLEHPHAGTIVTVRNGRRSVEDGPFTDSKEQLGGFCIIDVETLEDAQKWAEKCPAAVRGFVDIRVIPDFGTGA